MLDDESVLNVLRLTLNSAGRVQIFVHGWTLELARLAMLSVLVMQKFLVKEVVVVVCKARL